MRLYHVTERSNLDSIMRKGLQPRQDYSLKSKSLSEGIGINLVGRRSLEAVLWEEPWNYPILLEVDIPRKSLVRLEHISRPGLVWYFSSSPIPSSRIRVIGDPSSLLGYEEWKESTMYKPGESYNYGEKEEE